MRGESAGRAVTRGADLLTGRDRVDGDRYQVDTVGGVKDVLRNVWLAAAGLSGGNWLLQGRCEAVTLAPLLMVLLL